MLPKRVDRRVGDRMQVVGDPDADIARPDLAGVFAARHHQFARRGAFRHLDDHERIRADDHRRGHFPDRDLRPVFACKPFAFNVKFAARDSGGWGDLSDCRLAPFGSLRSPIYSVNAIYRIAARGIPQPYAQTRLKYTQQT